ncbi:MAG TPA: hypothetical protein VFV51_01375, partial [Vicinamibacterales bacterium]|nr:hypothetical protein [Vicinamibacterales bacterium]
MLDFAREARTGLNEAIFCAGKTVGHIEEILTQVGARDAHVLLTRLTPEQHVALPAAQRSRIDYCSLSRTGFFNGAHEAGARSSVAVVAAGTSDAAVAREVARTLRYYGEPAVEITDVGVAGLWRLLE